MDRLVSRCIVGSRAVSTSEGTFYCCLEAWKHNAQVKALDGQREIYENGATNYIHLFQWFKGIDRNVRSF